MSDIISRRRNAVFGHRYDRTSPPSSPCSCQLVAQPKSRPKVETSTRPAPLQVDRSDPEGQQRHCTCRSVEARNRTWPWSVATAQAGYALNDDDDHLFVIPITIVIVRKFTWTLGLLHQEHRCITRVIWGSEFQTLGPATENARVPKVLRQTRSW